jgi:hypothetical protein
VFLTFISFSLQQHNSAALTKPHVSWPQVLCLKLLH